MKVNASSATSGSRKSKAGKSSGDGFKLPGQSAETSAPAPMAAASSMSAIAGVDAILALQGGGGEEARKRAVRKGRRLLDALDRLQVAILGEGPTTAHLSLLQRALSEQREMSGDRELDETLNWAEVRAAVEAAKLEKATHAVS